MKPIFKNQPISCPWTSCQPYPSSQLLKNKLGKLIDTGSSSNPAFGECGRAYTQLNLQPPSTHFFYFLRLMQLFPDTHPATLHTVLTLSHNNFFFAIDKLLYAQKCKSDLGRKLGPVNVRARGGMTRGRSSSYGKVNQSTRFQPRPVPPDLAEVQRILDLAEKPYLEVQSMENDETSGSSSFMETEQHEVIEIVCFDSKKEDNMDIENVENLEPSINEDLNLEPPVIVVGTMREDGHVIQTRCRHDDSAESYCNSIEKEITNNLSD